MPFAARFEEALSEFDYEVRALQDGWRSDPDRKLAADLRAEAIRLHEEDLTANAHRRLECFVRPKFYDIGECLRKYRTAMGDKRSRQHSLSVPDYSDA